MLKNTLAVVTGFLASFAIIIVIEGIGAVIYPQPPGFDMNDPEALKAFAAGAPSVVYVLLVLSYAIGAVVGGMIAAAMAVNKKMTKSITLGGILMGLGAYNLFMIPHPIWTIVISLFVFIPCSYLGGYWGIRISAKRRRKSSTE